MTFFVTFFRFRYYNQCSVLTVAIDLIQELYELSLILNQGPNVIVDFYNEGHV